ncbi:MAG: energy transducer TonB [Candidatus Electryoneaceae bacterium]|nr:energy transducer TonB [Candidatus Electryoneaceae bacterium]
MSFDSLKASLVLSLLIIAVMLTGFKNINLQDGDGQVEDPDYGIYPPPPPPPEEPIDGFYVVETKPVLIGGHAAIGQYGQYINDHNLFPVSAREAGVSGEAIIQFMLDTAGVPRDVRVSQEIPEGLGFGEAGITVMKAMRFTPGMHRGRKVDTPMQQQIVFPIPAEDPEEILGFFDVEIKPVLIGGNAAINRYISDHNLFPVMAQDAGVFGEAMIQFIVGTDGVPRDVRVVQEIPEGLGFGEIAVTVMKAMRFSPGEHNDQTVAVLMRQVITIPDR